MDDRKRVVSFSGGRSSAMMLHMLIEAGDRIDAVLFYNTGKERPETLSFVMDCEIHWGVPITWLEYDYIPERKGGIRKPKHVHRVVNYTTASREGEPFAKLIASRSALPNIAMRFCTQELKVETGKRYLKRELGWKEKDWIELLGIRYDEPKRWQKAMAEECRVYYPLVHARVTKNDVTEFWKRQSFDLAIDGEWSNCDLCFMKGRGQLLRLIQENPDSAAWWDMQEQSVGATFRDGLSYADLQARADDPTAGLPLFQDDLIDCYCGD